VKIQRFIYFVFGLTPWTFMLIAELITSFNFAEDIFERSINAFAVGSLDIHSIGKGVSSSILTS
jgi:hypothetical protein